MATIALAPERAPAPSTPTATAAPTATAVARVDDFTITGRQARRGEGPPPVVIGVPWPATEMVDDTLVRQLRTKVARQLADTQRERERNGEPRLADIDEQALGANLINQALEHHAHTLISRGVAPPPADEELALHQAVFNLLFGLGRLQDHLDRPDVVNIHAAGAQPVWLDLTDGRTMRGRPVADSDDELVEFVRDLGRRVGLSERLFDPAHPRINLQLPDVL